MKLTYSFGQFLKKITIFYIKKIVVENKNFFKSHIVLKK